MAEAGHASLLHNGFWPPPLPQASAPRYVILVSDAMGEQVGPRDAQSISNCGTRAPIQLASRLGSLSPLCLL